MKAKLLKVAKTAGIKLMRMALILFYCGVDPATPADIKALIFGDLAYLVSPLDAIPDFTPFIGYSDDLALLAGSIAALSVHIKQEHREKAEQTICAWFGGAEVV
jgi:uncharacterized membrane protein YkvA (DUF1232 family)